MSPVSRRAAAVEPMGLAGLLPLARAGGAIDLALGIPSGEPQASAVGAAIDGLRAGANQYADPAGLAALRAAVAAHTARTTGVAVDPDTEVTITAGATEGVFAALLAVTDPGDEVLLPEPYYENHPGAIRLAGAVPVPVPLRRGDWRLDPAAVAAAVTPRTRAVLLTNPHNPTGRVFDAVELAALREACPGCTLVTDEVYRDFVYAGAHVSPLAHRANQVVVGSLSKSARMTGWRIGYCVADRHTTAALRRVHERVTLGASHPLQLGATAALTGADDRGARAAFLRRRDAVVAALRALGMAVSAPEGGWFVLADVRPLGVTGTALAHRLVESAGVLVAPGASFFADPVEGDDWIRIALVRSDAEIDAALARMARLLRVPTTGRA